MLLKENLITENVVTITVNCLLDMNLKHKLLNTYRIESNYFLCLYNSTN